LLAWSVARGPARAIAAAACPLSALLAIHIWAMGRLLVVIGLVLVIIGVLWPLLGRLGLGRLPGDIFIRGQHGAFYFPITTCILISVVLSLLWWLLHR
jgi:Protein of unknown function (DUF2905)